MSGFRSFLLTARALSVLELLTLCLIFWIPYDRPFERQLGLLSAWMVPDGLLVPANYPKKLIFHISDILIPTLCILGLRRSMLWQNGTTALWILVLCALISLLRSPFAHYPIPYFHLWHLITPFLLFTCIANQDSNERSIQRIFRIVVVSALFQSLLAVTQYICQTSLGLKCLGEMRLHPYLHSSPSIIIPGGSLWRFDFDPTAPLHHLLRVSGTLPHANILGGMLVISLLMSYSLLYQTKRPWPLSFAILLQSAALFLTYSRSALFGWTGATILWCLFLYKQRTHWRLPATLFILSCSLALFLLWPQYTYRGGLFTYPTKTQIGDERRIHFQNVSLAMILDRPLSGVGYTQFTNLAPSYQAVREGCVHNIYLLIASEMGLPALIAFLYFLGTLLLPSLRNRFTPLSAILTLLILVLLWIGCVDFYPIFSLQAKMMLFLIAGLLTAHRTKLRFSPENGIQGV